MTSESNTRTVSYEDLGKIEKLRERKEKSMAPFRLKSADLH